MAAQFERKHVSKLIPADHRVLMPLLLSVAIVNSAVRALHSNIMRSSVNKSRDTDREII